MEKLQDMATKIVTNMYNIILEEDERLPVEKIEIEEDKGADFLTAHIIALKMLFENIAEVDEDIIGFTHMLNRLAFQYLMKKE